MTSTPFTFVTTLFTVVLTITLLNLWLSKFPYETECLPRFLLLIMLAPFVRIFFPFEFGFTYEIVLTKLYSSIVQFVRKEIWSFGNLSVSLLLIFLVVWVIGFLICMIQDISALHKFYNYFEKQSPVNDERIQKILTDNYVGKKPKVVLTSFVQEPMLIGLINPLILVPQQEFSTEELSYILCHELWHLKHGDLFLKWILGLLSCAFWWIPQFQTLKTQIDCVMEIRADQAVTIAMTNTEKSAYLDLLIKVSSQSNNISKSKISSAFFTFGNTKTLKRRFNAILYHSKGLKPKKKTTIALSLLVSILLIMPFALVVQPGGDGTEEILEGTYSLNSSDCHLVLHTDGSYDLYRNGEYMCKVTNFDEEIMGDLPVFNMQER